MVSSTQVFFSAARSELGSVQIHLNSLSRIPGIRLFIQITGLFDEVSDTPP